MPLLKLASMFFFTFLNCLCHNLLCYYLVGALIIVDAQMSFSMLLLPLLLPESACSIPSGEKSKRRAMSKPSVAETVEHFVDVQRL